MVRPCPPQTNCPARKNSCSLRRPRPASGRRSGVHGGSWSWAHRTVGRGPWRAMTRRDAWRFARWWWKSAPGPESNGATGASETSAHGRDRVQDRGVGSERTAERVTPEVPVRKRFLGCRCAVEIALGSKPCPFTNINARNCANASGRVRRTCTDALSPSSTVRALEVALPPPAEHAGPPRATAPRSHRRPR